MTSIIRYIQADEDCVGAAHETLTDVLNRPLRDYITAIGLDPDSLTNAGLISAPSSYYNVKSYGALGDAVTDDYAAFVLADAAAYAAGGGTIIVPKGTFLLGTKFTLSNKVCIQGVGRGSCIMRKTHTNAMIEILVNYNEITGVSLDANSLAGTLIAIPNASSGNFTNVHNVIMSNVVTAGITYGATAGSLSKATDVEFYGTTSAVPVIKHTGQDTVACPRVFADITCSPGRLYDVDGVENMFFANCYASSQLHTVNSKKLGVTGCRFATTGASSTLYGTNNTFVGCIFAGALVIDASFAGSVAVGNITVGGMTDSSTDLTNIIVDMAFHRIPATAGYLKIGANQVVGARGAAVADCTDAASVITQLNALLARLRTHGLIAP